MTHDRRLLLLAAVSGVLSYFGTTLLDAFPDWIRVSRDSGTWLPGLFFGALVMAPHVAAGPKHTLRQIACIALSALIYFGAVKLAMYQALVLRFNEIPACALSGVLGAVAVAATTLRLMPLRLSFTEWTSAPAWGAFGGAILGSSGELRLPDLVETSLLVLGFVVWQAGVGYALFNEGVTSSSRSSPART